MIANRRYEKWQKRKDTIRKNGKIIETRDKGRIKTKKRNERRKWMKENWKGRKEKKKKQKKETNVRERRKDRSKKMKEVCHVMGTPEGSWEREWCV